jgi:hypothetical protein
MVDALTMMIIYLQNEKMSKGFGLAVGDWDSIQIVDSDYLNNHKVIEPLSREYWAIREKRCRELEQQNKDSLFL